MSTADTFLSDWASPPGDTITELLEEQKMGIDAFALKMRLSHDATLHLIKGEMEITQETAEQLKNFLGGSERFWISREQQYRQAVRRMSDCKTAKSGKSWVDELPIKDLTKFGWIETVSTKPEKLLECLRFFGVSDVEEWRATYDDSIKRTSFRTSASFDSNLGALAAWLRQGELEAEKIDCDPWDAIAFRDGLSRIRNLTRKRDPNLFLPELQSICAAAGVAVVIVRTPTGCRASGGTRFISDSKAILALSFRYLSDDHFWFTFFHEAAHLLLHGKTRLFLEGDGSDGEKEEEEANSFAAAALTARKIPKQFPERTEQFPSHFSSA